MPETCQLLHEPADSQQAWSHGQETTVFFLLERHSAIGGYDQLFDLLDPLKLIFRENPAARLETITTTNVHKSLRLLKLLEIFFSPAYTNPGKGVRRQL